MNIPLIYIWHEHTFNIYLYEHTFNIYLYEHTFNIYLA